MTYAEIIYSMSEEQARHISAVFKERDVSNRHSLIEGLTVRELDLLIALCEAKQRKGATV